LIFRAQQFTDEELESRVFGVWDYLIDHQQHLVRRLWSMAKLLYRRVTGSRSFDHFDRYLMLCNIDGTTLEQEIEEGLIELSISLLI
jgi:hypothetical protein